MRELENAKILFIGPKYFGYENDIYDKLEELGASVHYVSENIDHINPIYSAINKLPAKISDKFFEKYFINKIKKSKIKKFDYIFLIRGKLINKGVILFLKKKYKNAKFIMYQWDSIKNVNNVLNIIDYFEVVYTFDKNDYEIYSEKDKKWRFRPLFFVDDYNLEKKNYSECDIDILFVGTYHSERNLFLKSVKDYCETVGLKFFSYLYIPRFYFFKRKFTSKEFRKIQISEVKFSSLNREKLINLIKRSKVIIDYQAYSQSGLTMRTIESLGGKSKLITTNDNIKSYDFYNSKNIMVLDKKNINTQIKIDFINGEYIDIEKDIYSKYSLRNWIIDIFNF